MRIHSLLFNGRRISLNSSSPSYSTLFPMNDLVSHVDQTNRCLRRSSRLLSATTTQHVIIPSLTPEQEVKAVGLRKRKRRVSIGSGTDEAKGSYQISPRKGIMDVHTSPKSHLVKNSKGNSACKNNQDDEEFEEPPQPKPKKKREPRPEPVYVIPDIPVKETLFKGRLGYACLNTVLRNKKPATEAVFCSRTCRLDSLRKNGMDWVKELGRKNVQDLATIIQWNEENVGNIRFFRISSEMFPFASHAQYGYSLDYCADDLAKAGALAHKYGHRLTTHPGQYTQLGSPKPAVVEAAIRDLAYHCQMLDLLGMGPDSVMIIHGGGVYGDKASTLERLKNSLQNLPKNIRARLVLENDEICYNAEDLLPICEELDIPLVFDYHHDRIFPSSISPKAIIQRAQAIWKRRGIRPKQHLSEERPGATNVMERRAHADRCESLPEDLPDDMDLMIEAKDKEQAVLYLHRMYNLQPVIYESLRPATANPSKQTAGRKSTKCARATLTKETKLVNEKIGGVDDDS